MRPADDDLMKLATRTDIVAGVITAAVVLITTAWLVMLLF